MIRMTRFDRSRADADIRKAKENVAQEVREVLVHAFAKGGIPDIRAIGQAVADLAFRELIRVISARSMHRKERTIYEQAT